MAERQFKIKVGSLRRLKKDIEYYAEEHAAQLVKIEKMRIEGKDEHDIRKQEEVLVEVEAMQPDCQFRLNEAVSDISNYIEIHRDELKPLEAFIEAQELLAAIPLMQK
ncbi:hypothetical protein CCR75_007769 [Bremia lactucae]|uniref:Tubulin-specific chaperone A n=1 Tax=Bremia lactucae TaxID=4779 RepID=A0A976IIB9_BRELC|nr:hypothetical protein CCR75_007769 [Bremia lactucae]